MAMKLISLPNLSRVQPGSKATLEMPVGPTYHRIIFAASGTALAVGHIGQIQVKINGKTVQTFANLQRLIDLNAFHGNSADSETSFALHFFSGDMAESWRRLPGVGTGDVATFHIEIQLDGAFPADGAIRAYAQIDPARQNLGAFMQVREFPTSTAVAGWLELDKLPRSPFYRAIHFFKPDANEIQIKTNLVEVIDATKAILHRAAKEARPVARVPVDARATHVDFTMLNGEINYDALSMQDVTDFRVRANLASSGSIDIVTETLDVLG